VHRGGLGQILLDSAKNKMRFYKPRIGNVPGNQDAIITPDKEKKKI
jgi:hypothetical protein